MSAALLQYQACLGIMVRLRVEDLTALKGDFERAPGGQGLSLREFVSVMLDRVGGWEPETVVSFIEDLIELFAQVDVNGDGTMEWEEFTSAIIEGGMSSSSSGGGEDAAAEWRGLQYEESARFVDAAVNRQPKRLQFLPEFRRVLLLDDSRPVIELLDPTGLLPPDAEDQAGGAIATAASSQSVDDDNDGDVDAGASSSAAPNGSITFTPQLTLVNKFHPLCYVAGYRRDQDDVRSERSPVQAVKFLDGVDLLAVSADDLKLTFWAATLLSAASPSALEMPLPLATVHTPRPQRVLEWNPATNQLFSISADLIISVWRIARDKSKCEVRLVTTLKKHTDLLQDLLLLNAETLLSCGMDSVIYVWDAVALVPRASRVDHRRGVRLLAKLSTRVFLTAGFECEIYGWNISPLATTPIFKLWGHNSPVCCIQLIPSTSLGSSAPLYLSSAPSATDKVALLADQAITVDDDGWFKWWNLADVLSFESSSSSSGDQADRTVSGGSAQCLQSFRLGSDKYPWKAHSLAVLHHGQSILAAGLHKLKLLQRVQLKPKVLASSAVLFNSVSLTLLTTTDRELRVWDAASGALVRTHRNVSISDITCVDMDARQRKIVFGAQNGELTVVNYLNGTVLNRWTPHQSQVSALIFCKEDQCVLTASWDRSLRLYDDNAQSNALLRCVTDAHDGDIKCLAYCHALSIFASGSADGVVKIWDYIFFFLEDTCVPPPRAGTAAGGQHQMAVMSTHGDVNVLEFIDPYPLLLSGHESGPVCVWSLSATHSCSLHFSFFPFHLPLVVPVSSEVATEPTSASSDSDPAVGGEADDPSSPDAAMSTAPAAAATNPPTAPTVREESRQLPRRESNISCLRSFFDERGGAILARDIRRGRFLLVVGNSRGELGVLDISQLISNSHARAFREENMPSRDDRSYNPRRRFLRQGKNAKRLNKNRPDPSSQSSLLGNVDASLLTNNHPPQIREQDVQLIAWWSAHRGNIRSLQVVDEPRGILTCSSDKAVRVWDFDGQCLGDLSPTLPKAQPPQQQQQQQQQQPLKPASRRQTQMPTSSPILPEDTAATSDLVDGSGEQAGSPATCDDRVWKWEVDCEGTARLKREQAQRIWNELKDDKMGIIASRRQSVVLARRERRRSSSIHLSASASAPVLGRRQTDTSGAAAAGDDQREPAAEEIGDDDPAEKTDASSDGNTGHTGYLFDQLKGKSTWKLSDIQIARQVAWEREREKFRHRMKRIMKSKARQQGAQVEDATGDNQAENEGGNNEPSTSSRTIEGVGPIDSSNPFAEEREESLVPTLEQNPAQDLPFGDKDNWAVGSLNRERQMYSHFHHENVRRSNKRLAGSTSGLRLRRLEASIAEMDLAPSAFLLEKLGASCVIHENVPLKMSRVRTKAAAKLKPRMAKAQSMSALSVPTAATGQSSSVAGVGSMAELPRQATIKDLFQQYDKLFIQQETEEQELVRRTTGILDRAVSFRSKDLVPPVSTGGPTESETKTVSTASEMATSQARVDARKRIARRLGVDEVDKQRKATQAGAGKSPGKPLLQPELPKIERESVAKKKQRLRSDAALMRQDRFGPYSREDVVNIYRTFRKLDQDQSGSITLQELFGGAGLFSGTHMQDNVASIFSSVDEDQSGQIELPELCRAVFTGASAADLEDIFRLCELLDAVDKSRKAKKKQLSPEQLKELEALFKVRIVSVGIGGGLRHVACLL